MLASWTRRRDFLPWFVRNSGGVKGSLNLQMCFSPFLDPADGVCGVARRRLPLRLAERLRRRCLGLPSGVLSRGFTSIYSLLPRA
jgi:hypothetical protein